MPLQRPSASGYSNSIIPIAKSYLNCAQEYLYFPKITEDTEKNKEIIQGLIAEVKVPSTNVDKI